MKKYIMLIFPLAVVLIFSYAFVVVIVYNLNMPLVATDYDHNCVWVEVPTSNGIERRTCPEELSSRYDHIYVNRGDYK